MMDSGYLCKPFFIEKLTGNLFIYGYLPIETPQKKEVILHIPAFGEEMNKSRRMIALQAKKIAKQGREVYILDLFGTGDSSGDFGEATWIRWKQDISTVCTWLKDKGNESIILWGLRLGNLLALDFISETNFKINKLICWQPVLNGESFIMQFLRLRSASSMMHQNVAQEKTSELKEKLLKGQSLEIAGYTLNADLAKSLIDLNVNQLNLEKLELCSIFEIVSSLEKNHSVMTIKFSERLKQNGKTIFTKKTKGSPFWSTQEISVVPELLIETIKSLASVKSIA